MNIRGAELVCLIEKEVKNLIGTDGVKGLRDRSKSFRITIASDTDVVIMNLPWRIIAEHENLISAVWNEEEINSITINVELLAEFLDSTAGGLTGDHELIREAVATFLERKDVVAMHSLDIDDAKK